MSESGVSPISSFHAIEEYLARGDGVLYVSRTSARIEALIRLAQTSSVAVKRVPEDKLDALCGRDRHRGAALVCGPGKGRGDGRKRSFGSLKEYLAGEGGGNRLVLLLDGVTDIGNYGAILRSADQFEADCVVVPSRRSAGPQSADEGAMARASAGASGAVSVIVVPNLVQALGELKKAGFWIYGADMAGRAADATDLKGSVGLVMGSEGKGLHDLVRKVCDGLIKIPTGGTIDSLNVSVAAGILLYEVRRQQKHFATGR